ncbi:MAG: cardiolipin synthase [Bacteroidales bacterium]|nr:cardiolipin synthase [Bacteroidales bacterium]
MTIFLTGLPTLQNVLTGLYIITVVFVCFIIIFQNRAPYKTLSWVMVVLLIPVVGIIFYLLFGQNYRKQKIFSHKSILDAEQLSNIADIQANTLHERLSGASEKVKEKEHIIKLMLNNNKSYLTEYNKVNILIDGKDTFPSMFESIAGAKRYINMEVYRFESDILGMKFCDALVEKAKEGVKVRVIFDDVGSWNLSKKIVRWMRNNGVQIYPFMPVSFPWLTNKINYRNHRKILVVDGVKGYVGGLNIADKYLHGQRSIGNWRDTHLFITGEAVTSLNNVFMVDWYFVSKILLNDTNLLPDESKVTDKCWIQIAFSGPDSDWSNIMQVYFSAIATARKYIYLCTPYFSPDETILNALFTTSLSGVDVRLILPGKSDSPVAYWNTRSYIEELMEAGIKIYLYNEGFNHSKYLLVDNVFASVGSANVDMRSFDLNFEIAAMIYDEDFAARLLKVFYSDISKSNEIKIEEWKRRKKTDKYKESLARILGPLY